ncbi:MAG: phosphotransferase [Chitinispirillaceae bacterium]
MFESQLRDTILNAADASGFEGKERIQSLWDGYGEILRVGLEGSPHPSVIVKHIRWPDRKKSRSSERSHQRKVRSYQVEMNWYEKYSSRCTELCRVPRFLGRKVLKGEVLFVLEDLDRAGYSGRKNRASMSDARVCLEWLAGFHARFMGERPEGLWKTGTYWHLATRPDELKRLEDTALRNAASAIDRKLKSSPFQTFVHGDAKLANFCFSRDGRNAAAVDFQYVGGGCGMKDVAYLAGSCFDEHGAQRMEKEILDFYFKALRRALSQRGFECDTDELEKDWRSLYPVAWTDFHRFLKGWAHGHWPSGCYSERVARKVASQLS